MDRQSELLQAVIENTEDDAPRLAYADWCAAQQQQQALLAHAEFIRLQIEIGNTPLPVLNSGAKYFEMRRIGELADKWSATWAQPLAPYVQSYQFHRGFPALIRMAARTFLEHAKDVFALAPIRHLDLTGVREVAAELFKSDSLLRIYSLSLNGCGLTSEEIRLMTAEPKLLSLRWLSFENNLLDYEAARILAGAKFLKNLRVVKLDGNPVNPTEELGYESGQVVDTNLPESGERLEKEFGRIPWLHWTPDNSRFS